MNRESGAQKSDGSSLLLFMDPEKENRSGLADEALRIDVLADFIAPLYGSLEIVTRRRREVEADECVSAESRVCLVQSFARNLRSLNGLDNERTSGKARARRERSRVNITRTRVNTLLRCIPRFGTARYYLYDAFIMNFYARMQNRR